MLNSILILGSAPDAVQAQDIDVSGFSAIVAINNAWQIRPDWTHLIYPDDFAEDRRPPAKPDKIHITSDTFVPANNAYGGIIYAGGTMAFTATYWALHFFKPDLIAILGCDMVYNDKKTHFYGTGEPDPLRKDPTLQSLEAKSARLMLLAAQQGCLCMNLSTQDESRLLWPRLNPSRLPDFLAEDHARYMAGHHAKSLKRTIEYALSAEEELAAFCEDGAYWNEPELLNEKKLSAIDDLWLQTWETSGLSQV